MIAALTPATAPPLLGGPRYLGADERTARTAGSGMGALTGERARGAGGGRGEPRSGRPPPAARGWRRPPSGLEDAPRRPRSAGRAPRAGAACSLRGRPGCAGRRGREVPAGVWVPSSALRLRSLGSPPGRCSEGAVSCLPRAAGLVFSTLGFVPRFPLSCER